MRWIKQKIIYGGCLFIGLAVNASMAETTLPYRVSAQTCGAVGCHDDIYAQWQDSMHAHSSPLRDEVHAAAYQQVVGDPKKEGLTLNGQYPICLKCHAPNAAKDRKTKIDQENYAEGVNCLTCHTVKRFLGVKGEQVGIEAYDISTTHLQGPSGRFLNPDQEAVHPFPMQPRQATLRSSEICLGCHSRYFDAKGHEICATGEEYQQNANNITCQSCHMPKLGGQDSTDHSFLGGHSDTLLKRAVILTVDSQIQADQLQLTVTLRNMLPHKFPSGSPYRYVLLTLSALDTKDKLLWSNFDSLPRDLSQDPKAVFKYTLLDKKSQPASPFIADKTGDDSRLKPNETRQLRYQIPQAKVAKIRAELLYNVLTPEVIDALGDELTGDLASPAVVAISEIRLPAE